MTLALGFEMAATRRTRARAPASGDQMVVATLTIPEALGVHAKRDPTAPAIVSSASRVLSFGDLDRHIHQIGLQLMAAGIGTASRVGIALRGPEAAVLGIAVCCRAILVPL